MTRLTDAIPRVIVALLVVTALLAGAAPAEAKGEGAPEKCAAGFLSGYEGDDKTDLEVSGPCEVRRGSDGIHRFRNVNILDKGVLTFTDAKIDFWATSILVENGGSLIAGTKKAPIGTNGVVTIHLYGKDQGTSGSFFSPPVSPAKGILCKSTPVATCGAPPTDFNSNGANKVSVPNVPDMDYFYPYHPLPYDDGDHNGYFGYKVLAVSYGGTLQLFGKKGAKYCKNESEDPDTCVGPDPSDSGRSWVRLDGTAVAGKAGNDDAPLKLASAVDWQPGDKIVITTTDYLPHHSEQRIIKTVSPDGRQITLTEVLAYTHNGQRYPLSSVPTRIGLDSDLQTNGAETRAAVALLSRSIRIVSEGQQVNQPLETSGTDAYFGGHAIFRQGFKSVQIQGVEFYQMGQGGRTAHYPVHFHHARRTPPDTFVKDSSIWDSMTRWIVLHGTQDVTLARNVGYKSIGHGFYLEDGTEINNKLYANIGIFARAAVMNSDGTPQRDNPRKVPGILAAKDRDPNASGRSQAAEHVPFRSDYDHPAVFWIMNGWNDFQYNMAAGAGACGVAYWLLPGYNSGMSRMMKWESYASLQSTKDRAGITPLKTFVGNSATTTQVSFNTVGNMAVCHGVGNPEPFNPDQTRVTPYLDPIVNPLAPDFNNYNDPRTLDYYPGIAGGGRLTTRCDTTDCSTTKICSTDLTLQQQAAHTFEQNCVITQLDHYTSSFHWAEFNFGAIWLRPLWYLVTNSVLTDVQGGGLNFVTSGGYDAASRINGHWALVQKSVMIGQTQGDDNPYALNGGPINPQGLQCASANDGNGFAKLPGNHCLAVETRPGETVGTVESVSFPVTNFGMSQRMFSVYDGPAFQDSVAYLNIKTRTIDDCKPLTDTANEAGLCDLTIKDWTDYRGLKRTTSHWLAGRIQGLPAATDEKDPPKKLACYMPNAAIGWKQPNGFYYPPAFHSNNLFFATDDVGGKGGVDIRHFVIEPVFKLPTPAKPRLFVTASDTTELTNQYCLYDRNLFTGFTDVDRQTVLNDDDGSLTGYISQTDYKDTISVNLDHFFNAPKEAIECRSDNTAKTSPYEYVTTVVYPHCAVTGACATAYENPPIPNPHTGLWDRPCTNQACFGVPLYRQNLTQTDKNKNADPNQDTCGNEPDCAKRIFMMGQSIGQRSSLTVNQGTYYVDTTTGQTKQEAAVCPPNKDCNLTVFQRGDTYYLFVLFAKTTTKQTYLIYVGKDATFDDTKDVWMTQADIRPLPIVFTPPAKLPSLWKAKYDKPSGILRVDIDMSIPEFVTAADLGRETNCRPLTFCTWDKGSKTCREGTASDAICRWAVKDLDCPAGGCFGIGFKLPSEFSTDPTPNPRLSEFAKARCFPNDTTWNVSFADPDTNVDKAKGIAGVCYQSPKLADDFCNP